MASFFGDEIDQYIHNHSNELVSSLGSIEKTFGTRNSDIAARNGWTRSKVSKLRSLNQILSTEDYFTWCSHLGVLPASIISDKAIAEKINGLELGDFYTAMEFFHDPQTKPMMKAVEYVARYQLPRMLLGMMKTNIRDFSYSCEVSSDEEQHLPFTKVEYGPEIKITFKHLRASPNPHSETAYEPQMILWVSLKYDLLVLGTYFNQYESKLLEEQSKSYLKNLTGVDDEDGELANRMYSRYSNKTRFNFSKNEIKFCFIKYNELKSKPMEYYSQDIYKNFCSLVRELYGLYLPYCFADSSISRSPAVIGSFNSSGVESYQSYDEHVIAARVIENNGHQCEIDKTHRSFVTEEGTQYMEAIQLMPANEWKKYDQTFSDANYACLCPTCAAQLKHGTRKDRENMLIELYRAHKDAMESNGFNLSLSELLKANGL